MVLNYAYKIYWAFYKHYTPGHQVLDMGSAMTKLMHDLCQRGPAMLKLRVEHPSWIWDLMRLFGWLTGYKI
jgi:hypothetical protein